MHVINMETSNADKRLIAMVRQTPMHAFMFDQQGQLLVANDAAMEACLHSSAGLKLPEGQEITLTSLFALGAYEGGLADVPSAAAAALPLPDFVDRLFCLLPH